MPSPFPGMDPYLEHPDFWQEFHSRLIVAIADALGPQLRPLYRVAIEKRVYEDAADDLLIGRPDATIFRTGSEKPQPKSAREVAVAEPVTVEVPMPMEIYDRYLEIRDVSSGEVVTTVELISPTNKRPGRGRRQYETKRLKILGSQTHLVEIDLLRALPPLPMRGHSLTHYRILVSRAEQRPSADLYAFNLSESIPPFPLPLKQTDTEPVVDLQALLNQVYDRASYDLAVDYTQNPEPPITSADLDWLNHRLTQKGLRVK